MRDENKNMFLAIALSAIVLLAWNYFYGMPQAERQRRDAQVAAQTAAPGATSGQPAPGNLPSVAASSGPSAAPSVAGGASVPNLAPGAAEPREAVIARTARVPVETPTLKGSINLVGARIDDLLLTRYRETVEPGSRNIVLFSPSGSNGAYYAEFGFVTGPGATVALPDARTTWTLAEGSTLAPGRPVTLTWDNGGGLVFRRTFEIDDSYMFTVRDAVENRGQAAATLFPYGLISRHGTPQTAGFFILHEGLIGVLGQEGLKEYTYGDIEKERTRSWKATGGFVGLTDKYWAAALAPDQSVPFEGRFSFAQGAAAPGQPASSGLKTYQTDALYEGRTVAPGATATAEMRLFAGAKEVAAIDGYQARYGIKNFDLLIDWGWFYFITKPMFHALHFFGQLFGNFGLSILFVTVLIKLAFFPLANKSYASMAKMKAVQPEMMALRERYPDDRTKQQQALMELYKREKINPIAGCWPILVQIPVFFALYKVLFVTLEMRHAPFFGWIRDLSGPDPTSIFNLFGLLPFAVPAFLHIGVWAILMGITMFVQMKMNPEPTDPIQKTMFAWMPVIFTFMMASFPAGLLIYWTWNNFLSILQQYFIMKRFGVKVELWDNLRGMFNRKPAEAKS